LDVEAAEDAALRLSADERLRLIERLWESVVDERGDQLAVTSEMHAELDRRLAAHRRAPDESLSWSEIQRLVRDGA
jgi:putative addiction module component (TIGR02574 family)